MKAIKEFLKPNWWKIGIFILLWVFRPITALPIALIFFRFWGVVILLWPIFLIVITLYYYLLACLIYFIITKIKRLIAK